MKKPDLKFKKPEFTLKRRPSGPKRDIPMPKLARDLYADLRDRRLLPLIALLLVAIVAAPFLLGGSDEAEPIPVAAPPPAVGAKSASFSVVPADPGLREAGERLGYRKARDPFQFPVDEQNGDSGGGGGGGGGGSGEVEEEVPSSGGTATQVQTTTNVVVETDVTDWGIDIRSGFVGEPQKDHDHVPQMSVLPKEENPVVTFVGLSSDRKKAVFLMSSEVSAFYGAGKCIGEEATCQLLQLKPGTSATFAVGYGETRYKIQLKQIVALVQTHTERASEVNGE